MTPSERSRKIVDYLNNYKQVDISYLSDLLQVSEMTIRRDLDQLEKENFLIRIHGGARLVSSSMPIVSMNERINLQKEEKTKIAQYAASLVQPGEVISIDDSSTTYAMVPFLPNNLTVITNCLSVASSLLTHDDTEVLVLGGRLNKQTQSMWGKDMSRMLDEYHVDKVFLSSSNIDPELGLFDRRIEIAETKQAFMKAGTKIYYLCNHTKLHSHAVSKVSDLKDIDVIIMDQSDEDKEEQTNIKYYCEKYGVELILV